MTAVSAAAAAGAIAALTALMIQPWLQKLAHDPQDEA